MIIIVSGMPYQLSFIRILRILEIVGTQPQKRDSLNNYVINVNYLGIIK